MQTNPDPIDTAYTPGISKNYFALALTFMVLAFTAGIALGFFGRPLVVKDKIVEVVITATPAAEETAIAQVAEPTPTADSQAEEESPDIMDFLMSDARHIQGQPDAPITIIEFSDFK